mgnify:CR=1 FL=1
MTLIEICIIMSENVDVKLLFAKMFRFEHKQQHINRITIEKCQTFDVNHLLRWSCLIRLVHCINDYLNSWLLSTNSSFRNIIYVGIMCYLMSITGKSIEISGNIWKSLDM